MSFRQQQGQAGEAIARNYFLERGWTMVASNIRGRFGEIDLIMRDGHELVFLEVKYRRSLRFGRPEESITRLKLQRLQRMVHHYLERIAWEGPYRIDVCAITQKKDACIVDHFPNITPPELSELA